MAGAARVRHDEYQRRHSQAPMTLAYPAGVPLEELFAMTPAASMLWLVLRVRARCPGHSL